MPDGKKLRQDTLFVTSLEKGMLVLEAFSEDRSELGLSDIVKVTGLEKSAAQRYANTLHELGYLEKNAETRRFKPSVKYLEMAYSYLWSDYLAQLAMPRLIDLSRQTAQTINMAEPIGTDIIYVVRMPNHRTNFGASAVGRRVPALVASSGRVILSRKPETVIRECVRDWPITQYTPKTTTDREAILDNILMAREKGYCLTQKQVLPDEINIAAAICSIEGTPIGAIHCSLPSIRWTTERAEAEIAPLVVEAAQSIVPSR
ncbi:IclR family transcriptional regulator [Thalassospira alkalitolerans]|uniref:IclR family transcriptional regulator n=1 Tax=Thalassospira alkalitolerans TaxID=1293890 RepID=A0A1Y2LFU0_9PROT|nr:IclR family transcriptional regulator C-terminal domain-containing protein [Thalassospira alkalitolerans]OSQ49507.1 IclR family transcriptional regulator [Thalassospira alkalitolerans]|tara:strand:+ start:168580 stop:169359 length:780 start_codon:yes stop_codon:yes gene_type:complete